MSFSLNWEEFPFNIEKCTSESIRMELYMFRRFKSVSSTIELTCQFQLCGVVISCSIDCLFLLESFFFPRFIIILLNGSEMALGRWDGCLDSGTRLIVSQVRHCISNRIPLRFGNPVGRRPNVTLIYLKLKWGDHL